MNDLQENKLKAIDEATFFYVTHFDISHNEIIFIHPVAFATLIRLKQLNINGSRIDCSCDQLASLIATSADDMVLNQETEMCVV